MKVVVSEWAWLSKSDLTPVQIRTLRTRLTIQPRKVGQHPGEPPGPVEMFCETSSLFGIPRQYFLEGRRPSHEVEFRFPESISTWKEPLRFAGSLRAEQADAVKQVTELLRSGGLGGILRAVPGWGKCCTASTMLTDLVSGERKSIKDFVGQMPMVPSLYPNGTIAAAVASRVWESGTKPCLRVTLKSGQWIEASLDHPVLTQFGYKRLDELVPGREMLVATARTSPEPLSPVQLSDSQVIIAGLYLADGADLHFTSSLYCKGNAALVQLFKDNVKDVPGFEGFGDTVFDRGAWYVRPHGVRPWIVLWELDKKSTLKRIPPKMFGLPRRQLALLIRALWTDGNLYLGKPAKLEIALASEGMIDDLQEALRRFGIVARKSFAPKKASKDAENYCKAWRLQLADKVGLERFAAEIGVPFGMEEGFQKLQTMLHGYETNTNWDVVPVGHEELKQLRKECPHVDSSTWRKLTTGGSMRWMSRSRFERLIAETGYKGEYTKYVTTDVVWEGVESVVDVGEHSVYDITVPTTGNVVANGIVVHNTVWACAQIATLQVPTLIVVHKEFLMNQWIERIQQFLPDAQVGIVQQDTCDFEGKHIVVGMVHSLASKDYGPVFRSWPGLVITDEVHRIGSRTWSQVPPKFPAKWRIGLSATPRRKDGADDVFFWHIGPLIYTAHERRMKAKVRRVWTNFRVVATTTFNPKLASKALLLRFLCSNYARNRLVVDQLILALHAGRKILVLSERLNHLKRLEIMLAELWPGGANHLPSVGWYVGGRDEDELEEASKAQVVLATSQLASEGLDIPALDTLMLTTPLGDVEQAVGRILRPCEGKKDPIVVDFRDDSVDAFKRMAKYRDKLYEKVV
jgi:superfamily II DNA or RNA helicase